MGISSKNQFGAAVTECESLAAKLELPNVKFLHMDARANNLPSNQFDEVHFHYVFSEPTVSREDLELISREAFRLLRGGGRVFASGEVTPSILLPEFRDLVCKKELERAGLVISVLERDPEGSTEEKLQEFIQKGPLIA